VGRYFPEDTTYPALFWVMVSISYLNLIEIFSAIFEKVAFFVADFKGPYFWNWEVHIHWAPP
jgi:hypothetical protein